LPTPAEGLEELFRRTLPAAGIAADGELIAALAAFVRLLHKWNGAFNLTSIREPSAMAVLHVLDSLAARPFLAGQRILDAGCGAGLPGIPLALVEPARNFTLMDSGNKKVRFVRQAVAEIGLRNVTPVQGRVEQATPAAFDTIVCRAFSSLADFAGTCGHALAEGGRLVAMKGRYPADELEVLGPGWDIEVDPVRVPDLDAERHIVVLTRADARAGATA
jgi:16S rRNA (guanine527-N7)-methyltransferase